MKKSQRLQAIVDLNANDEKKALTALGLAQRKKQDVQQQLDNLQKYQQEYQEQFQSSSESGIKIARLLEFNAFIVKLKQAIDQHQSHLSTIEQELGLLRGSWEHKHMKTKNFQKISHKARSEENQGANKREQFEQDDRTIRWARGNGIRNAK